MTTSIQLFLTATRNASDVLLRESANEHTRFLWDIYDEIVGLMVEEPKDRPELVVTVSKSCSSQTQLVSLDRQYIVIELHQLYRLAREITSLQGYNEKDESIPIFFSMLARAERSLEMTGKPAWDPNNQISISIANKFKPTPREQKIIDSSAVLGKLALLDGFPSLFKPIVAFVISHELFHWLAKLPSWSEHYSSFTRSLKIHHSKRVEFDYVDNRIVLAYSKSTTSHQIEEIFCDEMALMISWRICINKSSFHPSVLCFSISLLHSILLHIAYQDNNNIRHVVPDLFARKIYALRLATVLYDKYIATLVEYMPRLRNQLGIIFGTNEVVIEFVNYLAIKSILDRVTEDARDQILKIEDVRLSISDDEVELGLTDIPSEYFQLMIAHNLNAQLMIVADDNPMCNPAANVPKEKIESVDFLESLMHEMETNFKTRTEFLGKFWKKVTR